MFLGNIDNPVKVRNQLKRMFKQNPQYCYSWDFESRQVYELDINDYVASLYEIQINGMVKRCECWVKQRFIAQKPPQVQNERKNSIEKTEKSSKSPKYSELNGSSNNSSNNKSSHSQNNQNSHGQSNNHLNSAIIPQHDKFVVRFESYGHSKRERMTQSVNPLSYAFDKILVDYVYLFIETEEVSKQKLIKEINKSIQNARYYDATRKVSMLEEVFNEKNTPLIQGFINTINQKKYDQEKLNQVLTSNLQTHRVKAHSTTYLQSKNSCSPDNQKKQQLQNTNSLSSNQKHLTGENKANGKQATSKDKSQDNNMQNQEQTTQNQPQQNQLNQQQSIPSNLISHPRTRSQSGTQITNTAQSPNKGFSLQNNSPQKSQNNVSPKKVSAFNSSPSKSQIAQSSDNNLSPKQIPSSVTTRSGAPSPKKVAAQGTQKVNQQIPQNTASPSPKSSHLSKSNQNNQVQQSNFKPPQHEISTRSQTQNVNNNQNHKEITPETSKQKKKVINENEKCITISQLPIIAPNSPMQTRHQEQLLNQQQHPSKPSQSNHQNSNAESSHNTQTVSTPHKTSAKSSDLSHNSNHNQSEMEIEEKNIKQQASKDKPSSKQKAIK